MQWILIIAGIIFLLGGLLLEVPAVKNRIARPMALQEWDREETRVRQARQDVERAREDVATLLEELDRASDKVVSLMTTCAMQVQEAQSQTSPTNEPLPLEADRHRKSSKKPADDKYQTVYELATRGMTVDDIAQLAKIGRGEVQLLLELKDRGGNR